MNHQIAKPKIFLQALTIAALSIFLAFFVIAPAPAAGSLSGEGGVTDMGGTSGINNINVNAKDATAATSKFTWQNFKDNLKKFTWDKVLSELKKAGDVAWRQALKYYLNTLAYDMATYLATGDKGQLPMFETQGWGGYLSNVADNAAGTFIEQLGKGGLRFNLCNPDFNVLLKINLGLYQSRRPKAPACTFSKMTANWDAALKDKNFLPKFQDMFNPWSNDLGIALTLQTGMESQVSKDLNAAIKDREESGGFKAVKDTISGAIKTPGNLVREAAGVPLHDANASEKLYTGSIIADSIDIFINTLAGKLITKWLKGGLVTNFPKLTNKLDSLTNINAQNPAEGLAGAQGRMKSIVEPNFKVRADYDILVELATCPDPTKAGPTNCVIDEKFRQAIEKKMTVGEALKQGYLSNSLFGFLAAGRKDNTTPEPMFNEGYPYRSMIILRKYRIIPVGWEIAAQKINDGVGVSDAHTLGDLVACFSSSDDYKGYNDGGSQTWCADLVDPDWVLKAPQNFCKKEGAGPEIISQQVTGEGSGSSLAVLRNDTYCADEQSVITEKNDGSPVFGYCTEERRKWDFNANACEPRSNTCQTFGSSAGQTNSYLENTLDFGPPCGPGNVGCQKYAIASSSSYDLTEKSVDWQNSTKEVYLNRQAETCDSSSEGCQAFIRLNPGGGANLLINADFEEPATIGGWDNNNFGVIDTIEHYQGNQSLKITNSDDNKRLIPIGETGYDLAGESYALSFYAKCASGGSFWLGDVNKSSALAPDANNWIKYNLVYTYPKDMRINSTNKVTFSITSNSCLIDNIKLERSSQVTNFSDYGAANSPSLIHEKLMPDYLMSSCYADAGDRYVPEDTAPAICSDFARPCKKEEIGCELYTSVASGNKIPAKTIAQDYCPAECVGYNVFIQSETPFDSKRDAYFIPRTAKACGAEAAGCDEFTNLEQAATTTPNVAENKEYYSSLRQCVKKSEAPPVGAGSCGEFYTWEGSDESGFQLKVESLALDENSKPLLTAGAFTENNYSNECDQTIYNSPVSDPRHKDDCRQLYSHAGTVFYALYVNTKTCSENCHPYRLTSKNIFESVVGATGIERATDQCIKDCGATDDACQKLCSGNLCTKENADQQKTCKQADDTAIYCRGGGLWSTDNGGCIYMAVPSQGVTCSAAQTGCREYTGSTGNNIRKIFTDDFGNGVGSWSPASATVCRDDHNLPVSCVLPSSEALTLDANNKGSSLQIGGFTAKRPVGTTVHKGSDYVLDFVAKAKTGSPILTVGLGNGVATSTFAMSDATKPLELTTAWQIFKINLTGLNHDANANEILRLSAGEAFYIDNITLTEITDRYYLIKNSWKTPDSCDENLDGGPEDHYMLYCDQYTDRASKTQNLKQFNKLCSESAVGCELMIDTKNSADADATYYRDGGKVNSAIGADLTVPADSPAYVVYDTEKFCGPEEKGCERLGQQYKYEDTTLYGDAYLKNNPDKYNQILCSEDAVGCDIFTFNNGTTDNGEKYFKDPGDQVCEWRRTADAGASESWLKKKIKRCDANSDGAIAKSEGSVCLSDANCDPVSGGIACANDAACGDHNKCVKPSGSAKGICYRSCITDKNDYVCGATDESKPKTLGLGGSSPIIQPAKDNKDVNWTGLCPAADSGCTEYIDPVSKFNSNQIFNGSFADLDGDDFKGDGWGSGLTQSVTSLEPNTVYRLATEKNNSDSPVDLKIHCSNSTLYALGEDNQLSAGNLGTDVTVMATNNRNSQLFYYKVNASAASASCTVTAGNFSGAVELKKVAIDYQLRENLDSKSCNGLVNTGQGCVLFNERSQDGAGLNKLKYDADILTFSSPATDADKDSNIILKVAPDRVCDKWLACKSYIKDAKGDNVCFDVGLCDAVDANGNCQSFIRSDKENQAVGGTGGLDAAAISNLSGYSKVGIVDGSLKTDYYPFGKMEQAGEVANVSNGGFEYSGSNGYPIGWSWGSADLALRDKPWNVGIFSIVNNPIAVQSEGIGYAPEGSSFLKLGSSYEAVSEQIDVMPLTDYIITAYVNTKNLKNGLASIDIMDKNYIAGYPDSGTAIPSTISPQDVGMDWSFKMGKFKTGPTDSQIKVKLYSSGTPEGNFYFDDIKIRPALNSRTDLAKTPPTDWYTAQSCRLYPQSDSLSCDYYEDSGKRQKGWPGYCLEYDRRPGDPNTCLLWYPIDKVKGDGIEEGAGYLGKTPVYYCVGGKSEIVYEYRHAFYRGIGPYGSCEGGYRGGGCKTGNPNYIGGAQVTADGCAPKSGNDDIGITCKPDGKNLVKGDGSVDNLNSHSPTSANDGWYLYDNDNLMAFSSVTNTSGVTTVANVKAVVSTDDKYAKFICDSAKDQGAATTDKCCSSSDKTQCDKPTDVLNCACILTKELYRSKAFCTNVVQTVSPVGQNKYWSSRVYEGSDYTVDPSGLNYKYGTDATPFGSMVPPSSNPYDWDGQPTKDNNQPIYYSTDKTIIRSGKGYGCTNCNFIVDDSAQDNFPYAYESLPNLTSATGVELVKNLFAQSYGAWDWKGSHYEPSATIDNWSPPKTPCSFDPRGSSNVYCAIPPKVINIQVNGNDGLPGSPAVELTNSQFIKLSFNTVADSQQLPLVMYGVDWGDGTQTIVTGVEMRDKPNEEQPEIIYHLYSYWDLKAKANMSGATDNNIDCLTTPGQCTVQPKIQIRDNWGWCNLGATINICDQWDYFGDSLGAKTIIVKEKGEPGSGSIGTPASCSCVDGDRDGHYPLSCLDTDCSPRDDCNDSDPAIVVCSPSTCTLNLTRPTTCGVGACFNTGTETCTAAGTWEGNTCIPLAAAPAETCGNSVDENCNGSITDCPLVTFTVSTSFITYPRFIKIAGGSAANATKVSIDFINQNTNTPISVIVSPQNSDKTWSYSLNSFPAANYSYTVSVFTANGSVETQTGAFTIM